MSMKFYKSTSQLQTLYPVAWITFPFKFSIYTYETENVITCFKENLGKMAKLLEATSLPEHYYGQKISALSKPEVTQPR